MKACWRCQGTGIMLIRHLRTNYCRCDECDGSGNLPDHAPDYVSRHRTDDLALARWRAVVGGAPAAEGE